MPPPSALKIVLRTGLTTAGAVVLYQLSNLFLIYHYLRYEYAMLAAVVFALGTGIFLSKKYGFKRQTVENELHENPLDFLTPKELQILEMIHQGKTNKEIAVVNFVELSTIKTHVNNIYGKLEVNDRKSASKIYALYSFTVKSSFSPPPKNA